MRFGTRVSVAVCVVAASIGFAASASAAPPEPEEGWAQRALDIQYEIGSDVGFTDSQWVGTHNSFNSFEQSGVTLSAGDANQQIDLADQLDAGIRSLELDVHRSPDIPGTSGPIRVCHGRGADQAHFGCTTEKLLAPTLADVVGWLDSPAGEDQVILLYLEDHMGDADGYDAAAQIVQDELGDRLYAPPGQACTEVPADLTRDDIRAAGKQVVIVSDCGPGTGWAQVAFNWDSHVESRPVDYADYPDCGPDYDRATYDSVFVRYFEDTTALTNVVGPPTGVATPDDGITPPTAAAMARCGVDLVGLDQVSGPDDDRLAASVWSWQVNRPRPGRKGQRDCAVERVGVPVAERFGDGDPQTTDTRAAFLDQRCSRLHLPACRDEAGEWSIPGRRGTQKQAKQRCERRGLSLGTPRTGYEAQLLAEALQEAGERQAWLGLKRRGSAWQPIDSNPL